MKGLYFLEQDSLESFTLALFYHLSPNPDQVVRHQCDTLSVHCQLGQFVQFSTLCGVIQDTMLSAITVCQFQYFMWSHVGYCQCQLEQFVYLSTLCGVMTLQDTLSVRTVCLFKYLMWSNVGNYAISNHSLSFKVLVYVKSFRILCYQCQQGQFVNFSLLCGII